MQLKTKFTIISAALFISSLATGGLNFAGHAISDKQHLAIIVTQRHMEADMMHDGIRGNVYSALVASKTGDTELLKSSQDEVVSMGDQFAQNVKDNMGEDLPDTIKQQFEKVSYSVENYKNSSRDISQKAKDYESAIAMLPKFNEVFGVLEEDQGKASDLLLAWSDNMNDKTKIISLAMTISLTLCLILSVGLIAFAIMGLFSPLKRMLELMQELSNKNLSVTIPFSERADEMGYMAQTLVFFQKTLIDQQRAVDEDTVKLDKEWAGREYMKSKTNDFDIRSAEMIKTLSRAAEKINNTANELTAASTDTIDASQHANRMAVEANDNVQLVAAASHELGASSNEIAHQITSVAEKASRASAIAETTSAQVGELNVLADSIGDVIGAIKTIAEQTNLLALNATIEAARAGEAGKGFAVVADEVKKLANETSSKTIEIDERIAKIQTAIRNTVDAVQRIISDVREIDHATSTVASAVEEQNAATSEISRNVSAASKLTQDVSGNISGVIRTAEGTTKSAQQLNQAASELSTIAGTFRTEVATFINDVSEK